MTEITTAQVEPSTISKLVARALFYKDVPPPEMLSGDFEVTIKVFEDDKGDRQTSFHLIGYRGDTAQSLRDARRKTRERESSFLYQEGVTQGRRIRGSS